MARCEAVAHNFSFSHGANLLHPGFQGVRGDTWPADARAFSRPTHFLREKPWDEVGKASVDSSQKTVDYL